VDHLPAAYVDFALGELIEEPEEAGWASFHNMSELGIGGAMDYHPPAHVQGPFLRLLRTHEDVLLAAARCPRNRFDTFNRRNVFGLDPRLNGARGLAALVDQRADDEEVRLAVLGQIFDPQ
jgi:hypothetical protein